MPEYYIEALKAENEVNLKNIHLKISIDVL
jgi:hypothetical protein